MTGPRTRDARSPQVTCRSCNRTWTPTREDSYYHDAADAGRESATSGRCFTCLLHRVTSLTEPLTSRWRP